MSDIQTKLEALRGTYVAWDDIEEFFREEYRTSAFTGVSGVDDKLLDLLEPTDVRSVDEIEEAISFQFFQPDGPIANLLRERLNIPAEPEGVYVRAGDRIQIEKSMVSELAEGRVIRAKGFAEPFVIWDGRPDHAVRPIWTCCRVLRNGTWHPVLGYQYKEHPR